MKKILALFMVVIIGFSVVACGSNGNNADNSGGASNESTESGSGSSSADNTSSGEPVKAVMISVMSGGSTWGPIEEGWRKAAEEIGWQAEYWSPVTTNNNSEMIELMESAITQGYKVISICASDVNMWGDVIKRAQDAGCIVAGVLTDLGEEYMDFCAGFNFYSTGYQEGEYLAKVLNEDGVTEANFFTIQTIFDGGEDGQDSQRRGFVDAMTEYFEGTLNDLGADTCDSSAATAQDKLNATYLIHPDMNCYYGLETYAMVAGASFVEEHGLQGKFYNSAPDALVENLQLMLDGAYSHCTYSDCYSLGYKSIGAAKTLVDNETLEERFIPLDQIKINRDALKDNLDLIGVDESELTWPE